MDFFPQLPSYLAVRQIDTRYAAFMYWVLGSRDVAIETKQNTTFSQRSLSGILEYCLGGSGLLFYDSSTVPLYTFCPGQLNYLVLREIAQVPSSAKIYDVPNRGL